MKKMLGLHFLRESVDPADLAASSGEGMMDNGESFSSPNLTTKYWDLWAFGRVLYARMKGDNRESISTELVDLGKMYNRSTCALGGLLKRLAWSCFLFLGEGEHS